MNAVLIEAAEHPRDGVICIQTFHWVTLFPQVFGKTAGPFQWRCPVSVTSIQSIVFAFEQQTNVNAMNYYRGVMRDCMLIGGFPLNADLMTIKA